MPPFRVLSALCAGPRGCLNSGAKVQQKIDICKFSPTDFTDLTDFLSEEKEKRATRYGQRESERWIVST